MSKQKSKDPRRYVNRELSWLEFNDRVLREGLNPEVPLLERLKFLAIVSSNLDEFFMIRVAGLKQAKAAGVRRRDFSGLTPTMQLTAIHQRVLRMVAEQTAAIRDACGQLRQQGLELLEITEVTDRQQRFLAGVFDTDILPALTPLAIDEMAPRPVLPGLSMYLGLLLTGGATDDEGRPVRKVAVLPVPRRMPRYLSLPSETRLQLVRLEDVIARNAASMFPGHTVLDVAAFRLTRDGDVAVESDDAAEILRAIEEAVHARTRRAAVRMEIAAAAGRPLRRRLMELLEVDRSDVYEIDGMLDAKALFEVAGRPGFEHLKYEDWPPAKPAALSGDGDDGEGVWRVLQERDVLLSHPYESFDPVVQMVATAAEDSSVLAIKQTLYRTSGDSPIIAALVRAAENGKQVTVLVELKARFDEANNVTWARRLEAAGCFVIYGIAGYKTHAKALLIVRRESHGIRRYAHLATGNYNSKTAKLYADVGLMTANPDMTGDAAAFFNLLTGYSQAVGWKKFWIAPTDLRRRVMDMIEREIQAATPARPGLIIAKVNSLQDQQIIDALYRASQAGVQVRLNVRGICCLRPGLPGVSDNIEVTSIIDRYLEHARIFYFRNGGHEEVYLSSADWMVRNIDKRLEILFPVEQKDLRKRLLNMLETCLADNVKARRMLPDGAYEPVARRRKRRVRAQERFRRQAVVAANARKGHAREFRPLARPED